MAPGTLTFSLTTLYGSNFEGGHLSRKGTTSDGGSVPVPLYRHEVSLDYARVELGLQYVFTPTWDLLLRVPWERKEQTSFPTIVDPATAHQQALMEQNIALHHRSGTFEGVSDLMLLGRRRWSGLWRTGDSLQVSGGVTLPTGRTVENPYLLGDHGIQHLHIQFGTGTINPLIEASYSAPVRGRLSSSGYLSGRFSLYENDRTFKAPPELSIGFGASHRTTDRLQLRAEAGAYVQGYGYWDGFRDENTGLFATNATIGATVQLRSFNVNADVRFPISQRTLTEGDTFRQGPTFVVTFGGVLRRPATTR